MNTLPWFERNLILERPIKKLPYYLERLQGTIVRIESKVKGVSDDILSCKLDGKWSVKQNIGHMAEVVKVANKRISEMLLGKAIMSPTVFEPLDYNFWSIDNIVALFCKKKKIES